MAELDLDRSQQQLGRTIERARAGEDRELAFRVRELGELFVRQLYGLLRLTTLHSLDNQVFDKPLGDLEATLRALVDLLGAIHVITVERQVYVNDIRIRTDPRADTGNLLGQEFRRFGVGGISFHEAPSREQLRALVYGFAEPPDERAPRRALQEKLRARGVDMVDLMGVFRFRVTGETVVRRKQDVHQTAMRATSLVDATIDALGANRMPNPLPLRRAVTEMLEIGPDSDELWDQPRATSPYGAHTLRVAVTAMLIGKAIGLPDAALQDLGVAALFHDVGYAAREGARPPTPDDPGDPGHPPPFERHPGAGARLVLRQRGFHEAKILRALCALEHHRDHDHPDGRPTLVARIVRIAEAYDNLQRPRGGNLSPAHALAALRRYAGTRYDPVLVQALANRLGRFPPGTLLQLRDGRRVRARSLVRSPETFDKPRCRVILDADGRPPDGEVLVDLAVEGEVRGVITPRRPTPPTPSPERP